MSTPQILAVVVMGLGVLICFWGYRLFKLSMAMWGFLVGAVGFFMLTMQATQIELLAAVLAVVGGIVTAVLCWFFYLGAVFVLGFSAAGGLAGAFSGNHPVIMVIAGALAGMLALWLQRVAIIVASSALGAFLTVTSLVTLFTGQAPHLVLVGDNRLLAGIGGSLLTAAGVLIQSQRPSRPLPDTAREAPAEPTEDADDEDTDERA